jgi:hypothetical protein
VRRLLVPSSALLWGRQIAFLNPALIHRPSPHDSHHSPSTAKDNRMNTAVEQEIINLSRQKWEWMSNQDVAPLAALFNEAAVFVHMGATMSKEEELNVIETGQIHYRDVDIDDVSVRFIDSTAIVLTKLQLGAVVGGRKSPTRSSSPRSTCTTTTHGPWARCPSPASSRTDPAPSSPADPMAAHRTSQGQDLSTRPFQCPRAQVAHLAHRHLGWN